MSIAVLVIVSLVLAVLFVSKALQSKPIPGIPLLAGASVAKQFGENPAALLTEARKKYGNIFTVDLFLLRMTICFDKSDILKFFKAPENEMTVKATKRFVQAVVGPDAWESEGPDGDPRYMSEGLLRPDKLQFYFNCVNNETRKQFARLAEMEEFDLFPEISRIVVLCNLLCFLGEPTYKKYGEEFARAYYNIELNAFKPLSLVAPWIPTASNRLVKNSRKRLVDIIAEETESRMANKEEYKDNMDYLQTNLNMAQEDGYPQEKYAKWFSSGLVALMFAAHTNTAGTLAWSLAHIGSDPKLQERAHNDAEQAIGGKAVDLHSLNRLNFLDNVLKETIRRYALLFLSRRALVPTEYGGHAIPTGEIVAIAPHLIHNDPEIFPNPESYNPDRFAGEDYLKYNEEKTYMPWGFSPHRCLGEKFANTVLKTSWLELFANYKIEILSPISPPDFSRAIGMPFCQGSIRARLTKLK
eukprot:TRINITY_DN7083_c0_g1_i1.p1 TRINITY_DN7083_c0_g1~~TRINITY_DN7083_c0_g1_i1.p1  ORF type:complete len:470 (-),score=96.83 TRINITY_DN7083_c0_g1_i1:55-1464(-)